MTPGGSHADLRLPNEEGRREFFDGTREACIAGIIAFFVLTFLVFPYLPEWTPTIPTLVVIVLLSLGVTAGVAKAIKTSRMKARAEAELSYRAEQDKIRAKQIEEMKARDASQ